MKIFQDDNYGADADGNRGTNTKHYEMEDTNEEREDIVELLYERVIINQGDLVGIVEVDYQGITIEVKVESYYPELMELAWEGGDLTHEEMKELCIEMLTNSREVENAK